MEESKENVKARNNCWRVHIGSADTVPRLTHSLTVAVVGRGKGGSAKSQIINHMLSVLFNKTLVLITC